MDKIFLSPSQQNLLLPQFSTESTFCYDETLPKLPLPNLESTLKRYLESVEPFLTLSEFQETQKICESFKKNEGPSLQAKLQHLYDTKDNWLSEIWLRYAYLKFRGCMMPHLTMCGGFGEQAPGRSWKAPCSTYEEGLWNFSLNLYYTLTFWIVLRKERYPPNKTRKGVPFTMYQLRYLFSACRIPAEDEDYLRSSWKPEKEGPCPNHLAVSRNGYIYTFVPFHASGEPYNPYELFEALLKIKNMADDMPEGPGIGALTGGSRDNWFSARKEILEISRENREAIDAIESAMLFLVLDKERPTSYSDVQKVILLGNPTDRWTDKSYSLLLFDNGYAGCTCDHSPFEGVIVSYMVGNWTQLALDDELLGRVKLPFSEGRNDLPLPERLNITISGSIKKAIDYAKEEVRKQRDNIRIQRMDFEDFGHKWIKETLKVPSDIFMQVSIQLAYYRLHGKVASTYETAATRKYKNSRTETIRTCTNEMVQFVKAFVGFPNDPDKVLPLLQKAILKHGQLTIEASNGSGCDRHLLGLAIMAIESGDDIPDLFTDPAFVKSGGNGNYILSTSHGGMSSVLGGTAPMCQDGYGCFYIMDSERGFDRISCFLACFAESYETSLEKFSYHLRNSMKDVASLIAYGQKKLAKL